MEDADFDPRLWSISLLGMAYDHVPDPDSHREQVELIVAYFEQATRQGIDRDRARTTLHNEILDIAPVIEPFSRVLKRVLKNMS